MMSRGHVILGRRVTPANTPIWLRRKLDAGQRRDLTMAHHSNLDAMLAGEAGDEILWQTVGGALTWSQIVRLLMRRPDPERFADAGRAMAAQLQACHALIERYRATGQVRLEPAQTEALRAALPWMEAIADYIDQPTAERAADWAEARLNEMRGAA